MNIAQIYPDSKTIVDKPTNKSSASVLGDFNSLVKSAGGVGNVTVQQIVSFMEQDFVCLFPRCFNP